jgi:hypothetical protein
MLSSLHVSKYPLNWTELLLKEWQIFAERFKSVYNNPCQRIFPSSSPFFVSLYLGPDSDSDICESKPVALDDIHGFIIKFHSAVLFIFQIIFQPPIYRSNSFQPSGRKWK